MQSQIAQFALHPKNLFLYLFFCSLYLLFSFWVHKKEKQTPGFLFDPNILFYSFKSIEIYWLAFCLKQQMLVCRQNKLYVFVLQILWCVKYKFPYCKITTCKFILCKFKLTCVNLHGVSLRTLNLHSKLTMWINHCCRHDLKMQQ